jgi:hypothetical protein
MDSPEGRKSPAHVLRASHTAETNENDIFDAEYVEISFPRSGLVGQSPVKIG